MVVRMAYFPDHLAVPVRFQDHASLEGKAAEKALQQGAALCEIAGQAWRVRPPQVSVGRFGEGDWHMPWLRSRPGRRRR